VVDGQPGVLVAGLSAVLARPQRAGRHNPASLASGHGRLARPMGKSRAPSSLAGLVGRLARRCLPPLFKGHPVALALAQKEGILGPKGGRYRGCCGKLAAEE